MRRVLLPFLLLAVTAFGTVASAETPAPGPTAAVSVEGCPASGQRIPVDYSGLSIEWSMVPYWFGTSADTAVAATAELLRNLSSSSSTTGVLRIGGNSQDGYRWAPDGDTLGNTLFFGNITTGMIDALLEVARQSGWKVVLGLNLRDDQPAEAAALGRYAVDQDSGRNLIAVAPGNEPDSYLPRVEDYLERYGRYVVALNADPLTRAVPLTGPDVSNGADLGYIEALRRAHSDRLSFFGWHHYGNRPTLTKLLGPDVQERWLGRIGAAAQGAALTPSRMSEGNSVGRGGLGRVSDVTGSTAWLIDSMLTGAAAGLAGFNVHAWDNHYYQDRKWTARYTPFFVREGMTYPAPGVYALALMRSAAGRRFCDVKTTDLGTGLPGGTVKAWALTGLTERSMAVYLVNKGTSSDTSARVSVTLPPEVTGTVSMSRIHDLYGCGGRRTTINGTTLQRDGVLRWTPEPLQRNPDGTVTVALSPCQTALLTVDRDELGAPLPPPF